MAAPQPVPVGAARGLGPFIVKTQDVEKLAELGRGSYGVVHAGKLKIAAKVSARACVYGCPIWLAVFVDYPLAARPRPIRPRP